MEKAPLPYETDFTKIIQRAGDLMAESPLTKGIEINCNQTQLQGCYSLCRMGKILR